MQILQNLSIRKKLTWIISLVAVITLASGFTLVILYEGRAAKVKLVEDSRHYAWLVGEISAPSLASNNSRAAERSLARLKSIPLILNVVIYNSRGKVFATYKGNDDAFVAPPLDTELSYAYTPEHLALLEPVIYNNREFGKILLRISTLDLNQRLLSYKITMFIVLGVLIAAAILMAHLLRGAVSKPIVGLLRATNKVASAKESAALIKKKTHNELDILRNRFNYMLEQMQIWEKESAERMIAQEDMKKLQRDEEKFRQIFEGMTHTVAVLEAVNDGEDFIFKDFNSAGERLEHIHRADLMDKPIAEVFPGIKTSGLFESLREVWKTGDTAHHPMSQLKAGGNAGWRETYAYKLPSGFLVVMFIDITERKQKEEEQKKTEEIKREAEEAVKQAEEAQKKAQEESEPRVLMKQAQLEDTIKELDSVFHAVSHDLSAPLDGIDECSKAFLEKYALNLDDKGKDYLIRIRAASQRMLQLFQDIDQLSQISLNELKRKPVDLSSLAQKKVIELKEGSPDRKAEFVIQDGVTAQGDVRLLGMLIEQLFNNSWTYTAQKDKTRIEFGVTEEAEKLEFFVKDNGKGFEMSKSEKIFIPFQTLHDDDVYPGTGMGLAVVRRIVHKHGGVIRVESHPGKGTTVFFTLGNPE